MSVNSIGRLPVIVRKGQGRTEHRDPRAKRGCEGEAAKAFQGGVCPYVASYVALLSCESRIKTAHSPHGIDEARNVALNTNSTGATEDSSVSSAKESDQYHHSVPSERFELCSFASTIFFQISEGNEVRIGDRQSMAEVAMSVLSVAVVVEQRRARKSQKSSMTRPHGTAQDTAIDANEQEGGAWTAMRE